MLLVGLAAVAAVAASWSAGRPYLIGTTFSYVGRPTEPGGRNQRARVCEDVAGMASMARAVVLAARTLTSMI